MSARLAALLGATVLLFNAGIAVGEVIEGALLGVNRFSRELLLEDGTPVIVPEGAHVAINGKPAWFDQIKAGSEITAVAEVRNGKYVAQRIDVIDPVQAALKDEDEKAPARMSDRGGAFRVASSTQPLSD